MQPPPFDLTTLAAAEVVAATPPGADLADATVTGPGFINLTFQDAYLARLTGGCGRPAPGVIRENHVGD